MIRVGIIGLGMMGRTHYEAYQQIDGARVIAMEFSLTALGERLVSLYRSVID